MVNKKIIKKFTLGCFYKIFYTFSYCNKCKSLDGCFKEANNQYSLELLGIEIKRKK
jgi:hypothetical protein